MVLTSTLEAGPSIALALCIKHSKVKVTDTNNPVNVLGLQWIMQTDTLALTSKSSIPSITSLTTKTDVLKQSFKVFDFLGLLIVKAKIYCYTIYIVYVVLDIKQSAHDRQWHIITWINYYIIRKKLTGI